MSKMLNFESSQIFFRIYLLLALFGTLVADLSEIEKRKCEQTDLTLECNYIPEEIPQNVTVVRIVGWIKDINSSGRICDEKTFQSNTWKKVQNLEISDLPIADHRIDAILLKSKCFFPLKELQELHVHSQNFELNENVFAGLGKLEHLDFNDCLRLLMAQLNKALKGPNKAPNLTELSLSHAGYYIAQFLQLDKDFVDAVFDKPITKIDASNTQITVLNANEILEKMKNLEYLNISNTMIGHVYISDFGLMKFTWKLKTIDASYATFPASTFKLIPGQLHFSNLDFKYNSLKNVDFLSALSSSKSLNFSGIVPQLTTIWFENCTFVVNDPLLWKTEELIFNKNNLGRLNISVIFGNNSISTLTKLGLSDNEMEFIHPSILAIFPNLQILDLSGNYLNKMAIENFPLFQTLLNSLKQLNTINLSNNGLNRIPLWFFEGNTYLEIIDLSTNNLHHVTFDLQTLQHLQVLNLSQNKITRFDQDSLNNLNKLPAFWNDTQTAKLMINLDSNPISCAVCEDQNSIDWLLRTIKLNSTNQNLKCLNENGLQEKMHETTLGKLQNLCRRKVIILVSLVTTGSVFIVITALSIIIYKKIKMIKRLKNRAITLNRLQDGQGQYEFVAFLGYSSDDDNFVNTYVIDQMNETLQQITGTNRNHICTGDQYFRPGRMVHDEITTCLERVCVMVVLVSDSYCSSIYCRSEFDQAHLYQKPIVLMLRGNVDEDIMPPAMKQLYRRNTRILWSEENGEYVLKTSWENVCSSILDLIK